MVASALAGARMCSRAPRFAFARRDDQNTIDPKSIVDSRIALSHYGHLPPPNGAPMSDNANLFTGLFVAPSRDGI